MDVKTFLKNKYLFMVNVYSCYNKHFKLKLILCDVDIRSMPKNTAFPHPLGIVIRNGTKIGSGCTIHQNVTIGQQKTEPERATIGNNVNIGASALVLGPVNIGDNAIIGAGSIILKHVPANTTVTGLWK